MYLSLQPETCTCHPRTKRAWYRFVRLRRGGFQRWSNISLYICKAGPQHFHRLPGQRFVIHVFAPVKMPLILWGGFGGTWRLNRDSLLVQRLGLCLPMKRVWVRPLVRELRSHMLHGQNNKKTQQQYCNKFNKNFKNGHIKKKIWKKKKRLNKILVPNETGVRREISRYRMKKYIRNIWYIRRNDYEAPPSMGFPRQEYWNGVPLPFPKWMMMW